MAYILALTLLGQPLGEVVAVAPHRSAPVVDPAKSKPESSWSAAGSSVQPRLAQSLPPITLAGRELSPAVDVWSLQEPAVPPDEEEQENEKSASFWESSVLGGALAGAYWGCVYGIGVAGTGEDLTRKGSCVLSGLTFAGIGAGAVALAKWIRKQTNSP